MRLMNYEETRHGTINYNCDMVLTRISIITIALGAVPLGLSSVDPAFLTLALAYNAVILAIIGVDYLRTPGPQVLTIERECQDELSMGGPNPVLLRLRNSGDAQAAVDVRDEPPPSFRFEENPVRLQVPARSEVEHIYSVYPNARGDFDFGDIYFRSKGPLGTMMRQFRIPALRRVRVYPDILQAKKYELLRRRGQKMEVGGRRARLMGVGTEFESLRDYQPDDEYRRIDWKASARRARLISRQYQLDRTQNILLVLDAGRTMCVSLGEMTKLDHAINAALMLGYVASSGDDKVGLMAFADEVESYLPPRKGKAHYLGMLHALYNIPLTTSESDYIRAFRFISAKWRKRSLVVVFTDLLDPASSRELIANLSVLARRHVCLCVAVGDPEIGASAEAPLDTTDEVYEQAAALQTLQLRGRAIAALRAAGVDVIDVHPASLSAAVVARYEDIKARIRI